MYMCSCVRTLLQSLTGVYRCLLVSLNSSPAAASSLPETLLILLAHVPQGRFVSSVYTGLAEVMENTYLQRIHGYTSMNFHLVKLCTQYCKINVPNETFYPCIELSLSQTHTRTHYHSYQCNWSLGNIICLPLNNGLKCFAYPLFVILLIGHLSLTAAVCPRARVLCREH